MVSQSKLTVQNYFPKCTEQFFFLVSYKKQTNKQIVKLYSTHVFHSYILLVYCPKEAQMAEM